MQRTPYKSYPSTVQRPRNATTAVTQCDIYSKGKRRKQQNYHKNQQWCLHRIHPGNCLMFVNYGLLSQPLMRHGRQLCYHSFGLVMVGKWVRRGKEEKYGRTGAERYWCNIDG